MNITVTFLEPFRLLPWLSPNDRDIQNNKSLKRGLAFARWHKCKSDDKGRPFITGTLLRSAVIRSAEYLLALSDGKIILSDSSVKECCPGYFDTASAKTIPFRRRATLQWNTGRKVCERGGELCPLCELLGKRKGKEKQNILINFGNLTPVGEPKFSNPQEIAVQRIVNRVDYATGKAHDFLKILEVDHDVLPCFTGQIVLADTISPYTRKLLTDSLLFTDRLCGALCAISVDGNTPTGRTGMFNAADLSEYANNMAEQIDGIIQCGNSPEKSDKDKSERLQLLAAAVRELRRDIAMTERLPKNHDGKEEHYLWDAPKTDTQKGVKTIRNLLQDATNDQTIKTNWQRFCEALSDALYIKAKEAGLTPASRILGDAEFFRQPEPQKASHRIPAIETTEFVMFGTLKAKTPFFFGAESGDPDAESGKSSKRQTDLGMVIDSQNRYRIPRSALRGILRRDLRTAFGTGCHAEVAQENLCLCKVCQIMKNITIMDTRSRTSIPPEVRQRIRINPYTGTAEEKALFSMEVGVEGMEFPFVMSYRGQSEFPNELRNVLAWWQDGKAFLGGEAATGKSVFELKEVHAYSVNLSDEAVRNHYTQTHGWRGCLRDRNLSAKALKKNKWQPAHLTPSEPIASQWEKVKVTMTLKSPFLNGDPIRALTEIHEHTQTNADMVSFMKLTEGRNKRVYAYKSESFRGVVRSAAGRRNVDTDTVSGEKKTLNILSHQDCTCVLCRLFGSEYETGKLRFEDLTFESDPAAQQFDHVAIDRFTGGAVEGKKFNDRSLVQRTEDRLKLTGWLWFRTDLSEKEAQMLGNAFADIRDGLYPLGANGSIGYGQVEDIRIGDAQSPEIILTIQNTMNAVNTSVNKIVLDVKKPDAGVSVRFDENARYYPYYFLPPDTHVDRLPVPVGHQEAFADERLTGKITCTLKTLTPLIIPDTETDDAFDMKKDTLQKKDDEVLYHKSHRFLTVNGRPVIPGSEIRGMISSVYEAITNSCFRIFDEKYRLSWRMEAEGRELQQFKPGKVTDDGKHIEEMTEYRYPFYDQQITDKDAQQRYFDTWECSIKLTDKSLEEIRKGGFSADNLAKLSKLKGKTFKSTSGLIDAFTKDQHGDAKDGNIVSMICTHAERTGKVPRYKHPTDTDRVMLALAGYNRNCSSKNKRTYKIVKPNSKLSKGAYFMCVATPMDNQNIVDPACLDPDRKKVEGYLKITGPNKLEKNIGTEPGFGRIPKKGETIVHNRVYIRKIFVANAKNKKTRNRDRLIPEFVCSENGYTYSMNKRCERIFVKHRGREIPITENAKKMFELLVSEYRINAKQQETPEVFQTILPKDGKITPGDLVYFREEKDTDGKFKAVEIIPVRISRKMDDRLIGKRMPHQELRPCHGEWIEDDRLSVLDGTPEKKLFTRNSKGLCPACRLFGTGSYKSRVRFGFAALQDNEPKWLKSKKGTRITLPLLERPRPTWAVQHETKDKDCQTVPGRKFYIHHHGWETVVNGIDPVTGKDIAPTLNNRTVEALDQGNTFEFEIFFDNLEPYELGLLLYTLGLENGLAHKLGMAKSQGFGSVEIDVKHVSVRNHSDWEPKDQNAVEGWIQEGHQKLAGWFGKPHINELNHIDTLKKLLYFQALPNVKVHYPPLKTDAQTQIPGYDTLKKRLKPKQEENETPLTRKTLLTTPWTPWDSPKH